MLLHITNGDGAAALLAAGGCAGKILPWRDVLHEGPVPRLDLEELSQSRAHFLASRDWGTLPRLRASFAARDRTLKSFRDYDEVVLWFEHDLYDQLQLAQILSWLAYEDLSGSRITLICIDRHKHVAHFRGLGDLEPDHVVPLFQTRKVLSGAAYKVACAAWNAFTSPDPRELNQFLVRDSSALPFMRAALMRHTLEFPSTFNGLGRTAQHALGVVEAGCTEAVALLKAHWEHEEALFLGDWSFWHLLLTLACKPAPLVTVRGAASSRDLQGAELEITETGRSVLTGRLDAVHLRGIDRWYGGVHLKGHRAMWRWDEYDKQVVHTSKATPGRVSR